MPIEDVVQSIPSGTLRSYTWIAERLGYAKGSARAAGQCIAKETKRRWAAHPKDVFPEDFPWWRIVGMDGTLQTHKEVDETGWRLQADQLKREGHVILERRIGSAPRVEIGADFK